MQSCFNNALIIVIKDFTAHSFLMKTKELIFSLHGNEFSEQLTQRFIRIYTIMLITSVLVFATCFTLREIVATEETPEKKGLEDALAAEILPERQKRSRENITNVIPNLNNVHQRLQALEKK